MTDTVRLDFLGPDSNAVHKMMRALATAESLTDELALKILGHIGIETGLAEQFLALLRCTNILIRRNSEWAIDDQVRRSLLREAKAKDTDLSGIHRLLLNMATGRNTGVDYRNIPRYLLTKAGQAYHLAETGAAEKSLSLYAESATSSDPGEVWLAGKLAAEQQASGVLPREAIEPVYLLALALQRDGDSEAAYSQFLKVAESGLRSEPVARSLQLIGMIEADRNEFDKALAHLDESVGLYEELDLQFGLAWTLRCRALVRQRIKNFKGALDDLNRAIPLCSGDRKARFLGLRAHVKRALNQLREAVLDLNAAIELARPETLPALLHQRGFFKHELHELEGALADLNRAAENSRGLLLVQILNSRAGVKRDSGAWEDARRDLDHALDLLDGDGGRDAHYARGVLLNTRSVLRRDLGDFEGALRDIDLTLEIREQYPSFDPEALRRRAKKIRQYASKIKQASTDSETRKVWSEIHTALARDYMFAREFHLAALMYLRAMNFADSDVARANCLGGVGSAYEKLGMYDKALRYQEQAADILPGDSKILATLARIKDLLGHPIDETRPIFDRALAADRENIWAISWFALALSRAGLHDEAIEKARHSGSDSDNPILLFNLAKVLDASPEPQDKKEAIRIAIEARKLSKADFTAPAVFLRERGIR
jgi:tetratricopeptide (TPR) repeat protein